MKLYLLRHGLAGHHGDPEWPDDSLRPLTNDGVKKLHVSMRGMQVLALHVDLILSSPYRRTMQTASIASQYLCDAGPFESNLLLPGAEPVQFLTELQEKWGDYQNVMAVGHEPDMSLILSYLVTGDTGMEVKFKKGTLCCVELPSDSEWIPGQFLWMMTPKQMMAIGG